MPRKPCETCVMDVGGAIVRLRHALEKLAPMYDELDRALVASEQTMKGHGWRKSMYGEARVEFLKARAAEYHVMAGHNSLRKGLAEINMEEPTDNDLVSRIGTLNFR